MPTKTKTQYKKSRYVSPKHLKGKTIQSINHHAFNVWHIVCTDGTKFSLSTQSGPLGLSGPLLETRWNQPKRSKKVKNPLA